MNEEDYPYTTVKPTGTTWNAVEVSWHPHGYEQTTWIGPSETEYIEAKRAAVSRAKAMSCDFVIPIQ